MRDFMKMIYRMWRMWYPQRLPHSTDDLQTAYIYSDSDRWLSRLMIVSVVSLMMLGLLAIYSASSMKGLYHVEDALFFVKKQTIAVVLCILILFNAWRIPAKLIEHVPLMLYLGVLLLLVAVFIPGVYSEVGGANRWMQVFGVRFQVSELSKIALILLLARNISRAEHRITDFWHGIVPNAIMFLLYAVCLMVQPDFGTTALLAAVCFGVLVVAGMQKRWIVAAALFILSVCTLLIISAPYRLKRIFAFLDPWSQVRDGGFQIIQSYLGFQNGGLWGRGLGESKQKLFFLPEAHTDFILSVLGEEMGFIGVIFVILCYVALSFCAFRICRRQQDAFWYLVCFGMTFMLSAQAIFNMGVVMGMLPTKGIPLPFVSNGLSSLLTSTAMVCVLLIAEYQCVRKKHKRISFE